MVLRSELDYLQTGVQHARLKQGLRTACSYLPKGDHQSNDLVEQCIQSVRQQANILVGQVEEKANIRVGTFSPLHVWSWKHSAFLLNQDLHCLSRLPTRAIRKIVHAWQSDLLDKVVELSWKHPGLVAGCVSEDAYASIS